MQYLSPSSALRPSSPSTTNITLPWQEFYSLTTTSSSSCSLESSAHSKFSSANLSYGLAGLTYNSPSQSPTYSSSPKSTSAKSISALSAYKAAIALSERDSYILHLHSRTRDTITPNKNSFSSRIRKSPIHKKSILTLSSLPSRTISPQSLPTITTTPASPLPSSPTTTNHPSSLSPSNKRLSPFRRPAHRPTQRKNSLHKAVLLRNSFLSAAQSFETRGNRFGAIKQKKRAKLAAGVIAKAVEVGSWTSPIIGGMGNDGVGSLGRRKGSLLGGL